MKTIENNHPTATIASQADRDGASKSVAQATVKASYPASRLFARGAAVITLMCALPASNTANATNAFPWGWCTWGAAAEFDKYAPPPGCDWGGNAGTWIANARARNWVTWTDPHAAEVHAIIVWTNGIMGHVGVVTRVYSDRITVLEMNWGKQVPGAVAGWTDKAGQYTTRDLRFSDNLSTPTYKFSGFIMPRKTANYTADYLLNNQAVADMQSLRNYNTNFGAIVLNSLDADKNWQADFQLRSAQFKYWLGKLTVYHATYNLDPKVRFTLYWEPLTGQWIGWTRSY